MSAAFFDSHKYAKRVLETGLPQAAADLLAETVGEIRHEMAVAAATTEKQGARADSNTARLEAKLDKLGADLMAQIERSKNDTTRWVIGVVISIGLLQAGAITALAMKLIH